MAHECPDCGVTCHCGGDIDDINFGEGEACEHCFDRLYGEKDEDDAPDWDVDDRLDELEMTKEEQENFMKPLKTKMQPNLDFPSE